jgi:putative aldouronate transport system substrate-binding protein
MKKKMFLFVLAVVLSAALFARGQQGDTSSSGKPVEVSVEVFDRGRDGGLVDPSNNAWTDWMKAKILKDENIALTFIPIPRSEETTALNNMMASGTAPDVCMTYSEDLIKNFSKQGGVFDMTPHIAANLPDLNTYLGPDPVAPARGLIYRNQERDTGKVFSIPSRRTAWGVIAHSLLFMRKDWLDILGLAEPRNKEEFFNTLVAFKEKDPGKLGSDKVIPFQMGFDVPWVITDSFVDVKLSDKDRWIYNDDVGAQSIGAPGYKDAIRYLNRMYNAGLINPEFPLLRDNQSLEQPIKSGYAGAFQAIQTSAHSATGYIRDLRAVVPTAQFVAVDCMEDGNGVTTKKGQNIAAIFWFVPAASKNPVAAMRYVNWLARPDNLFFAEYGIQGTTYDVIDGLPTKRAPLSGNWNSNSGDYHVIVAAQADLGSDEMNRKVLIAGVNPIDLPFMNDVLDKSITNLKFLPIIQPASPLTAGAAVAQTLTEKSRAFLAESIVCTPANFDRIYDAGEADWLASGGQAIINERREKYVAP